jgi:hypothetical protein
VLVVVVVEQTLVIQIVLVEQVEAVQVLGHRLEVLVLEP